MLQMSSHQWHSWTSLQLRALSPPGLVEWWISALDAPAVEVFGSVWGGGALNYVSAVDTIPVLHQLSRESHSIPYSPCLRGYSPTKSTAVTPWQLLSQQFANNYCCHRGESHSHSHFIRHLCSRYISIPHPPPHDVPHRPNLVCQKLRSRQDWNWIVVAWNTVICWLTNRMSIQQPDHLLITLLIKVIVDCVENSIQYWTGIFWIEVLLAIHLLLDLSCTMVGLLFVLNDLFQLLQGKLGLWAHTPALLKCTVMLGNSHTCIWAQQVCGI